jgi:hypothetical protein
MRRVLAKSLGAGIEERFVISVKTDNSGTSADNQFTLPTTGGGYNYDIETSDGQTITGNTGNATITFPSAGEYQLKISGAFPQCHFNNGGDKLKLLSIDNFGIYALGSTSQRGAFIGCLNLVINATDIGHFENVTDFTSAWAGCSSLTPFPLINTSSGIQFGQTWAYCSSLTSFPLIDMSGVTNFKQAWNQCSSLTSFPSNAFDTTTTGNYNSAFSTTNLTTQSIDNILISLDTSGTNNGTFTQSGGQAPSATGLAAKDNLVAKGWTITYTA